MSTLSLPQARIPVGWVMVAGQRVPVEIDIEWMRALTVIKDRVGGVTGPSISDVDAASVTPMQPSSCAPLLFDVIQSASGSGDIAGEPMQPDTSTTIEIWSV